MPHSKQNNFLAIETVKNYISRSAKLDHPLAELRRKALNRVADFGMFAKLLYTLSDHADGAAGSLVAVWSKEVIETGYIFEGRLGPPQSWHLGCLASLPASSFASQESASAAERCNPVS